MHQVGLHQGVPVREHLASIVRCLPAELLAPLPPGAAQVLRGSPFMHCSLHAP